MEEKVQKCIETPRASAFAGLADSEVGYTAGLGNLR
jgi:hypothetical protein